MYRGGDLMQEGICNELNLRSLSEDLSAAQFLGCGSALYP